MKPPSIGNETPVIMDVPSPSRKTMGAWLDTLAMDPPLPRRIIDRDAYLVTSNAPRASMPVTLSETAMSVSMGGDLATEAAAIDDGP